MKINASKIVKTGIVVSLLVICVLAVILFFTRNMLVMKILIIIGSIFLLASLAVLVLKYAGFYKSIHFSNPIGIPATDVAICFGVVGVFSCLITATFGMLFVPEFMSNLQAFMTESLRILRGLEKIFLTPPPQ